MLLRKAGEFIEGLRACKPLYAPSAQDKRENWYSILNKEKETNKKKARGASRLQAPLCAVRAGQKRKLVFYIEQRKRNKQEKSERGFALASPSMHRPSRTKNKSGILYW